MTSRKLISLLILAGLCLHTSAQTANRYDVVIDEIFPDPSPSVGLPDAEFIELKNVSSTAFDLRNWKIGSATGNTAIIRTSFILQPGNLIVICPVDAVALYGGDEKALGVTSFPSLNNDAGSVFLLSPESLVVHAVAYNKSWYRNEVKSDGGWSLEMIDPKNPCSGYSNWNASTDPSGGTPGRKNSVDGDNPDLQPPSLWRTYCIDSITLVAVFDEAVDSNSAAEILHYQLDAGIGTPAVARPQSPLFNEVVLRLTAPLVANKVYQLTVNGITDCAGNAVNMFNTAKAGLPQPADQSDVVINEILFNPKPGGYDYVEFYNRGNKTIDLKQLFIANRDITGSLHSIQQVSKIPFLFFPGEYFVVTENGDWLQQNYVVKDPAMIMVLPSLPSLPDDNGNIVLTGTAGNIVDELHYDHKWHFALVADESGVALERINGNTATQNAANWTSAASTAGFGTPTYRNSEFNPDPGSQSAIRLSPLAFSPDNDGHDDFCFVQYQVSEPGFVANIVIYDAAGRPVRYLTKNATLETTGQFRWDGLDDNQQRLPVGVYIFFTEIFNLQGRSQKFKNAVTLAGRL